MSIDTYAYNNIMIIVMFLGSSDYDLSIPYNVTIPAGQTTFSIEIGIANDSVLEQNEEFDLTIISKSLPKGFKLGNHSRTTVTIVDDDSKSVVQS